ncbi:hypothetical protein [Segetibacter aerophilus]|uniref:Lipoprotein n=1 Tax=Segetibacter aerophilus TaxID=670293 RepID=A0A512BGN0_9BACT|nr:hypothetical protein [Segetibacter aerophilus]GEO11120.1 hypothetical protein SAE01_36160 [Segetibacter aerophilus]
MFKNTVFILTVALIIFTGCRSKMLAQVPKTASNAEVEAKFLDSIERVAQAIKFEPPGELIATIEFRIRATGEDLKNFKEGFIPWVSLEHPEKQLPNLINPEQVALPYQHVFLIIGYPLNHPDTSQLTGAVAGFTNKMLIQKISERYRQIYQEEEAGAKVKTIPIEKRTGLINRNQTDGKYEVWGHDLGDLDLSSVEVYRTAEGKIVLMLGVES